MTCYCRPKAGSRLIKAACLLATLGLPAAGAQDVKKTDRDSRPALSLTLIPPSPVTDQIVLDVRAAVRNDSDQPREYLLEFRLDPVKRGLVLHRETVEVPPRSATGVRFRWPTRGEVGQHEILVSAEVGMVLCIAKQPIEILSSDVRSTRRIEGSWVEFYHWSEQEGKPWNATIKTLTDEQWRELVRGMHRLGMRTNVLQDVFRQPNHYVGKHELTLENYDGKAMYPSKLYPTRFGLAARDPVEAVLSESDVLGMQLFMGVGGYAWFDFSAGSLEWHKRIATELWEMYGQHRSFYGFYVSDEIAGNLGTTPERRREIVAFFREFTAHCRRMAPDKPVLLATNCHRVREALDVYPQLLEHLDILCPFAFQRMPAGDQTGEEAARMLQAFCDKAGAHLWMDLEVFVFDAERALVPRPIDGLISDLRRFPNFEKILCYMYPGLMNAPETSVKPGGEETVRLFREYEAYVKGLKPAPASGVEKATE